MKAFVTMTTATTEIPATIATFKLANRAILESLPWSPRSPRLLQGLPARGWRAKVADGNPAWQLWRANRELMESRGFRVVNDPADGWCLELWIPDETAAAQAREASQKTTSDLVVPAPVGQAYYPFQRAGVEFLASRSASLLSDEMGLGKSVEVAGLLNYLGSGVRRALIITPASMKTIWPGSWRSGWSIKRR